MLERDKKRRASIPPRYGSDERRNRSPMAPWPSGVAPLWPTPSLFDRSFSVVRPTLLYIWRFGHDAFNGCRPGKDAGVLVVIGEILVDRGDQLRHAAKHAAPDTLVGDFAKPALDHVPPRARCRNEMQMESGMTRDPGFDLRMLVGPVVVNDQVHIQPGRCLAVDLFEEADKLLMRMTRHAVADHFAIEHAQSGEQCCRPVALVIVRHGAAASLLDR